MLVVIRGLECGEVEVSIDLDELGHEICMGIRHGLCGADASPHEDPFNGVADAIRSLESEFSAIAEALNRIANKIGAAGGRV